MLDQIGQAIGSYAPKILGALAILVIGWILAKIIAAGVRALLQRTSLDERLSRWLSRGEPGRVRLEGIIPQVVYFLIMLFVLVACFQALDLTIITEPINSLLNELLEYAPRFLGALALLLVAWIVATIVRSLLRRVLGATGIDRRLGGEVSGESGQVPVSRSISEAAYWLIFLLFLPAILGALGATGLLEPVQNLTSDLLGYLPKLLAAGLILLIGWFVARIVQRIVTSLLVSVGLDRLGDRFGLTKVLGSQGLSGIIGLVVYILILIPVLIASLNALDIEAISSPATEMLATFLEAIPSIFAAIALLAIAYVLARLVSGLVSRLLEGLGFNNILRVLGISGASGKTSRTPSAIVGSIVLVIIMLFAATEAASLLGFQSLNDLVSDFLVFLGHVAMGLLIFALGLYLANLVARVLRGSGTPRSAFLSQVARVALLVFAGAMALRHMGLANEIVNLAFGLILGALAVAAAIAFGIGGRTAAEKLIEDWRQGYSASGTSSENRPS